VNAGGCVSAQKVKNSQRVVRECRNAERGRGRVVAGSREKERESEGGEVERERERQVFLRDRRQ